MFSATVKFGAVAFVLVNLVTAGSYKAGSTVVVNDIYYYVPSAPVSSLGVGPNQLKAATTPGEDLIPLTVMRTNLSNFDATMLREEVEKYSATDDVFNPGFLQGNLLHILNSGNDQLTRTKQFILLQKLRHTSTLLSLLA